MNELADQDVQSLVFLRSILACVAQPVWVVDHAGAIVFANPAALAALGYAELDQLLGRPSHDTIHYRRPDGSPFPVAECPMVRPRLTGEPVRSDEDWFVRKDGSMFPVSYTSAPIELPSGRGAVVAFSDIAEQRRIQQAIREQDVAEARAAELRISAERYQATLEAAFDGVVGADHEGRITFFNAAAERMFGWAAEEVLGRDAGEVIVPDRLRDLYRRGFLRPLLKGEPGLFDHRFESFGLRADGTEFPVEFITTRIELPNATICASYFRDITERRQAEADLRAARRRVIDAADRERRRIARDLHDGAQQQLVNVAFNLELATQQLDLNPQRARELMELAREEARAGIVALRELVSGIHPAILTHRGLAAAVTSLAGTTPLPVRIAELHQGRLPEAIEAGTYFIVSEALTNVVKHARASHVTIKTVVDGDQLIVLIADDGVGGAQPEGGSGLVGLADRVAALDGTLEIKSDADHGTSVLCRLPVGPNSSGAQ